MKRDMDLVRLILLKIEEQFVDVPLYNVEIEGYDMKDIAYHCGILYDGGFLETYEGLYSDNELGEFSIGSLTWEGHEFLDMIRDDGIWNKTKKQIREKGIPLVVIAIKSMAEGIVKGMINPF